jgi:hypothetical protein
VETDPSELSGAPSIAPKLNIHALNNGNQIRVHFDIAAQMYADIIAGSRAIE